MTITTKPRNDWDAIKLDYLNGIPIRDIATKHGIYYTQIVQKAKAKNWGEHNKIGKVIDIMIDDVIAKTDADTVITSSDDYKYLQQQLNVTVGSTTDDMLKRMIIKKMIMQDLAFRTGIKAYNVAESFLDITANNLKTSKDGLYTKSIGQGGAVTYASYADDIAKVVVPMIGENNKALGMTTTQVAIQNNVNSNPNNPENKDDKIIVNIIGD